MFYLVDHEGQDFRCTLGHLIVPPHLNVNQLDVLPHLLILFRCFDVVGLDKGNETGWNLQLVVDEGLGVL